MFRRKSDKHIHSQLGPLTDYIVSWYRKVGLWFDLTEHAWLPTCLNEALLMDGRSFVELSFRTQPFQDGFAIESAVAGQVYVYGALREDSRMVLENPQKFLQELGNHAQQAFDDLPEKIRSAQSVSLLSFEISQVETGNRTREWFDIIAHRLGGVVQGYPGYSGRMADEPDFHIIHEPRLDWYQIALAERRHEREVAETLAPYLDRATSFRAGTSQYHPATAKLRDEFGVHNVLLLARRF